MDALKESLKVFEEHLSKNDKTVDSEEELGILTRLLKLYEKVRNSDDFEDSLRDLKGYLGKKVDKRYETNRQQDAAEFLTLILENLGQEIKTYCSSNLLTVPNPVCVHFQYKLVSDTFCSTCDIISTNLEGEQANVIHLGLTQDRSLQSALLKFLHPEKSNSSCAQCQNPQFPQIRKYFQTLPKVLFLQAGRYRDDFKKDTNNICPPLFIYLPRDYLQKNVLSSPLATPYRSSLAKTPDYISTENEKKSFVRKLQFEDGDELNGENSSKQMKISTITNAETGEHLVGDTNSAAASEDCPASVGEHSPRHASLSFDPSQCEKYQLVSMVCHIGENMTSGHYIAFVFSLQLSKWFKCNDDVLVKEVSYNEVVRDSSQTSLCYFYAHV